MQFPITKLIPVAFALLLCGCATSHETQFRLAEAIRTEIYHQTEAQFDNGTFLKPREAAGTETAFKLAPLVVQEIHPTTKTNQSAPASSTPSTNDALMNFTRSEASIHGRTYQQWTYFWRSSAWNRSARGHQNPVDPEQFTSSRHRKSQKSNSGPLPIQGIRITLNKAGNPVIWEVLSDTSGAEIIFVAQSVEAAGASQFGPPLPGRRHSTEIESTNAPLAVVARVIEDGPTPIGPMVYSRAGTRNISAVLCRCMPSQVKQLVRVRYYRLVDSKPQRLESFIEKNGKSKQWKNIMPTDWFDPNRLERKLRLPAEF